MRYGFIAALAAFAVASAQPPVAPKAEDAPKDVKGLFLMSDFPAVTVRPGDNLDRQSAVAELRPAARAAGAVGRRRADGLDGDA